MILTENSFYTDAAGKAKLTANKELVMDAMLINFFGFLGLFKLANRSTIKTYETTEKKLMINSIDDTNHDVSLSIKLAFEQGLVTIGTVNKMTRLLSLIKQKQIKGPDLNDELIRELIKEIKYQQHRPSPAIAHVMTRFESGSISLAMTAKELWAAAKVNKHLLPVIGEFKHLVTHGQYQELFNKIAASTSPAVATAAPAATSSSNVKKVKASAPVTQPVQVKPIPIAQGQTDAMMMGLLKMHSSSEDEIKAYLKLNGVALTKFDIDKMQLFLANLVKEGTPVPEFSPSNIKVKFADIPLIKWIRKIVKSKITIPYFACLYYIEGTNESLKDIMKLTFIDDGAFQYVESAWTLRSRILNNTSFGELRGKLKEYTDKEFLAAPAHIVWTEALKKFKTDFIIRRLGAGYMRGSSFDRYWVEVRDLFDPLFIKALDFMQQKDGEFIGIKYMDPAGASSGVSINTVGQVADILYTKFAHDLDFTRLRGSSNKKHSVMAIEKKAFQTNLAGNAKLKQLLLDLGRIAPDFFKFVDSFDSDEYKLIALKDNLISSLNLNSWTDVIYDDKSMKLDLVTPVQLFDMLKSINPDWPRELCTKIITCSRDKFVQRLQRPNEMALLKAIVPYFEDLCKKPESDAEKVRFFGNFDSGVMSAIVNLDTLISMKLVSQEVASPFIGGCKNDDMRSRYKSVTITGILDGSLVLHNEENFENAVTARKFVMKYAPDAINMANGAWVTFLTSGIEVTPKFGEGDPQASYKVFANFLRSSKAWMDKSKIEERGKKFAAEIKKHFSSKDIANTLNMISAAAYPSATAFVYLLDDSIEKEMMADDFGKYKGLFQHIDEHFDDMVDKAFIDKHKTVFQKAVQQDHLLSRLSILVSDPKIIKEVIKSPNFGASLVTMGQRYRYTRFIEIAKAYRSVIDPKDTTTHIKFLRDLEEHIMMSTKVIDASSRANLKDQISDTYSHFVDSNPKEYEIILNGCKGQLRKALADNVVGERFMDDVKNSLFDEAIPIKPFMKLTNERINEILKYNKINIGSVNLRGYVSLAQVKKEIDLFSKQMALMNVKRSLDNPSADHYERMSVEYDRFNRYRHGNIAIKILDTFDVNLPKQIEGQKRFLARKPNSKIMEPVFHGTGSVAASMILRFGFAVIRSNDSSVAGRMLGDGIYFSNVLDKVSQYVSDKGFTAGGRGIGGKGYIFEMNAVLGDRGVRNNTGDYMDAGLGGDSIRSPEWCVYSPNEQLNIKKAHMIEMISKEDMDAMKKRHSDLKTEGNTMKITTFKQFLRESDTPGKVCSTFTFNDGMIPVSKDLRVEFEDAEAHLPENARIDFSGVGPMVTIEHPGSVSDAFHIHSTVMFMEGQEDADLFAKYLEYLGRNT